ncbi:MAG: 4a-hydroxytetrahydrobiopterin dehydratase [Caldilineaceae bacterium]|nr:4a-hydroxytetrahydrobiopterin dehydratase [Caldilineaceae bacterium]
MPRATALDTTALQNALTELPGWSVAGDKLHKEFTFKNFAAAFGFMASVAIEANRMDHHPEWSNVWNRVVIDLVTHGAGNRISALDVELAKKIDALAQQVTR